eukprot:jgi/Ulvmu1/3180/UM015_0221.1
MGVADFSLSFDWVGCILKKTIESGSLTFADIAQYDLEIRPMWETLCSSYNPRSRSGIHLLGRLVTPVRRMYCTLLLCKVLDDALSFVAPLILGGLVDVASSGSPGHQHDALRETATPLPLDSLFTRTGHVQKCVTLAALLFFAAILKAVITTQYTYNLNLMAIRAHGALMQAPLSAALNMPAYARGQFSEGHCQTLISVDARKLSDFYGGSHALVTLPLQIILALVILWRQVRMAFVAGLVLMIALVPINRLLAWGITTASQRMLSHKDRRLDIMTTLLSNLRSLFMMGWHDVMRMQAWKHRRRELGMLALRKYLDAGCVCAWALTSSLFAVTTFGLIAWWGQPLRPATVIVCLTLFNILIAPLNALPWVLNGVLEAVVSARRLAAFLVPVENTSTISPDLLRDKPTAVARTRVQARGSPVTKEETSSSSCQFRSFGWDVVIDEVQSGSSRLAGRAVGSAERLALAAEPAVQMKGASFVWSAQAGHRSTLKNLCFSVPKGSFCVLVGPSGSGKSSVLAAVLEDMLPTAGVCEVSGTCALAPQEPWLIADTIRDNIIMGSRVDEQRYQMVLEACELLPDIQAMPSGDTTRVTDSGDNLSGGQRARVSLARTLYAHSDIYLLDDCLAPLDGGVASCVLRSLLYSPLMSHATVVMASSHRPSIAAADFVITMEHGRVASVVGQSGQMCGALLEHRASARGAASPSKLPSARTGNSSNHRRSNDQGALHVKLEDAWEQCFAARDRWEIQDESAAAWVGAVGMDATSHRHRGLAPGSTSRGKNMLAGTVLSGATANGIVLPPHGTSPPQLQPHPSHGPHSPLPFFTSPDSLPEDSMPTPGANSRDAAYAHHSSSSGLGSTPATDGPGREYYRVGSGLASSCWRSTNSFTNPPQFTPDLQSGVPSCMSPAVSRPVSPRTFCSTVIARASTSDMTSLVSREPNTGVGSGSDFASAPTSPSHMGQPFAGYPQAWAYMRARGSSGSLSDLPLSVRAGESSSIRNAGGGGSHGIFLSSRGDGEDSQGPVSDSMVGLDTLLLPHDSTWYEERREQGHVKLAVYRELLSAVGWVAVVAVFMSLVAMQLSRTLTDVYVTLWSGDVRPQHTPALAGPATPLQHVWTDKSTAAFLRGLGALTVVALLSTVARAFLFASAGLKAAKRLHERLIDSVLAADLSLLSRIPHGRLLSRFSTDTEAVDDQLPFIANIVLASAAGFAAALLLMLTSQPLLLLLLAGLAAFYLHVQHLYRAGGREVRRLETASMSPLYSVFAESITGAATARSLGLAEHLQQRMSRTVSVHMAARAASNGLDQWLALRLQLASAAIVGALAFLAVGAQIVAGPGMSDKRWPVLLTGLGLAYALPMVSLLSSLLTASAEAEQEMVSVERIVQFTHLPSSRTAARGEQGHESAAGFDPGVPSLTFDGVSLTYPGRQVPALDHVSFTVPPGWHFGICGRTGAGKSSILTALFQLSSLQHGSVHVGDIDLSKVSTSTLQSLLAVVPQKPVILHGAIADNLDPHGLHSQEDLLAVLRDVRLLPSLRLHALEQSSRTVAQCKPTHARARLSPIADGVTQGGTMEAVSVSDDARMPLLADSESPCAGAMYDDCPYKLLGLQLGEGRVMLSVGQQQLLSVARALLRKPAVVCLDEVTAHLSVAESENIERVVSERLRNITCVRISHDVKTLMACNTVGILECGQLVEMGQPSELNSMLLNIHNIRGLGLDKTLQQL